jgi:hypothetical protein
MRFELTTPTLAKLHSSVSGDIPAYSEMFQFVDLQLLFFNRQFTIYPVMSLG